MANILIFKGAKRDFQDILEGKKVEDPTPFMELIRQYNVSVRANDTMGNNDAEFAKDYIEDVVIYADDFSSVTDHVISNFSNIVLLSHEIENLYIQNPPKRVEYSIRTAFDEDEITTLTSQYFHPNITEVAQLYHELLDGDIVGQSAAKKYTCIGLYKSAYQPHQKPIVILYYGPSGVGKTELAKTISKFYKGKLTRIQFSMMQTDEAYKYIFGDAHSRPSLARDLLARESNIILIDEFDKVSSGLYNVFYQMFDEGVFEDINYEVDMSNCVFIITSNFSDESSIATTVGLPIYSRIDQKVKFEQLSPKEIELVIKKKFAQIILTLHKTDQEFIEQSDLESKYLDHLDTFSNVRMLDKFIENDVYSMLMNRQLNI